MRSDGDLHKRGGESDWVGLDFVLSRPGLLFLVPLVVHLYFLSLVRWDVHFSNISEFCLEFGPNMSLRTRK